MRGIVSTKDFNKESLVKKAKEAKSETWPKSKETKHLAAGSVVIINLGVNNSTLKLYPGAAVVSHDTSAEKILGMKPEQVIISSGPGDPRELAGLVAEVKKLVGEVPLYGIQNGACVLALALGGSVSRMKVGHHGMNLPVVDPGSGKGEISAQNHSYGIEKMPKNVEVVHVNLNDKTIEKFQDKSKKCVGTLYFPIDERGKLAPGYQYV
jgi:carbamoyl-phosphate synthase small subunit